jgi:hypothetical protein
MPIVYWHCGLYRPLVFENDPNFTVKGATGPILHFLEWTLGYRLEYSIYVYFNTGNNMRYVHIPPAPVLLTDDTHTSGAGSTVWWYTYLQRRFYCLMIHIPPTTVLLSDDTHTSSAGSTVWWYTYLQRRFYCLMIHIPPAPILLYDITHTSGASSIDWSYTCLQRLF